MVRGSGWRRLIEDYFFFLIIQNNILASTFILLLSPSLPFLIPSKLHLLCSHARTNHREWEKQNKSRARFSFDAGEEKNMDELLLLLVVSVSSVCMWVKWWCRMIDGINQPNRQGKVFAASVSWTCTYFTLSWNFFCLLFGSSFSQQQKFYNIFQLCWLCHEWILCHLTFFVYFYSYWCLRVCVCLCRTTRKNFSVFRFEEEKERKIHIAIFSLISIVFCAHFPCICLICDDNAVAQRVNANDYDDVNNDTKYNQIFIEYSEREKMSGKLWVWSKNKKKNRFDRMLSFK